MVGKRGGLRIGPHRSRRCPVPDLEVVTIKGLLILALLAGGFATAVRAGEPESPYASYSNEALTALAAEWDTLDVHQRRALLTEVRQRMAQRGAREPGVIKIRTERRYGRIIRQPDGRVIRIETQVVHVRPATEAEVLAGRAAGFGIGFERRAGSQLPAADGGAPVTSTAKDLPNVDRASATWPAPAAAPDEGATRAPQPAR